MYAFTNQFSGPTLRQRVSMMNTYRSGSSAWWRYMMWIILMGVMALTCRHRHTDAEGAVDKQPYVPFPLTNATRVQAAKLDMLGIPWFRLSTLLEEERRQDTILVKNRNFVFNSATTLYPGILCLQADHLRLKLPNSQQSKVFINGQEESAQQLSTLTFEEVADLLVYQKWDDMPEASTYPESYRVFVSTTHKMSELNETRTKWKQFLLANAISDHPLSISNTFSMNKLLEATFFNNKLAFVKRTKDEHLKLYDEYSSDIDLYINGLAVDPKRIESVHVREVDKLYTRERSFEEWADGPNRQHRFVLYIQTSPKRAKRDSSYYVFSPFYTGDF